MSSLESRVLARHPEIRRAVIESPLFASWRNGLAVTEVDGVSLYVRGGDMLRDEDEIIFEWARRNGLLSDAVIESALAEGEGP